MRKKVSLFLTKLKGYVDVLMKIYPPYLIALLLFPAFMGMFINVHAIDIRRIYLLVVWITPFTLLALVFKKRIFYYIIFILIFINGFININFWVMSGSPVNQPNIFALFNSFLTEATDFFVEKVNFYALFLIPYCVLFYFSLKRLPNLKIKLLRRHYYIVLLFGIGFIAWVGRKNIHGNFIASGLPRMMSDSFEFYRVSNSYKQLKTNKFKDDNGKTKGLETNEKQITVLLVGESTSRNYMEIYGYKRKTNPRLSNFEGLIRYDDVISSSPLTMESIPSSMSEANRDNQLSPPETITLAEVFNTIGFNTYWISNQYPTGFWANRITLFAQQYNQIEFLKLNPENFYDEDLFVPFSEALNNEDKNQFIALHLVGTHQPYTDRYTEGFNVFKDGKSKKEKLRNNYDNAVLYNDFVVDSLLKIFRDYCKSNDVLGSAIYFSDHGESIYDCDNWVGHGYNNGRFPRCVAEIPFLVWLSPEYRKRFPQKTVSIERNKKKPFMTDDLFHAVLDISNVETPAFDPERSVFNRKYNDRRLRLFKNGDNYDVP